MISKPVPMSETPLSGYEWARIRDLVKLVLEAGEPALVLHGFTDKDLFQLHRLAFSHPLQFTSFDIATLRRIADLLTPEDPEKIFA
ncbi:hypothetical protein [Falsiruegeria mediterranea]